MSDKEGFGPDDLARWVRWAIIAFFVYALAVTLPKQFGDKPPQEPIQSANIPSTLPTKDNDCDCRGNAFNNFSLLAMPLFPVSSASVAIADLKEGTGEPLACGQRATLRYTYATRGGDVIYSNFETSTPTKNVRVGGGEMLPGFERGILGMKVGGERDISIPPQLGFGANIKMESLRDHKNFKFAGTAGVLTARAALVSVETPLPQSDLKLRIVEQRIGDDKMSECGDSVSIMLSLWSVDGKLLYSSDAAKPLKVTLGKSQLPYGIEQGIIGLMIGGQRTVIIPPAYMKPVDEKAKSLLHDVTLPKDQIVLAAIEIMPEKSQSVPTTLGKILGNTATEEKNKDATTEKK